MDGSSRVPSPAGLRGRAWLGHRRAWLGRGRCVLLVVAWMAFSVPSRPVLAVEQGGVPGGGPAQASDPASASHPARAAEASAPAARRAPLIDAEIRSFGGPIQTLFVRKSGDRWSLFTDELPLTQALDYLREAGGPTVVSRVPLERSIRISVHSMTLERVMARLLVGMNYSLHYHGGKLERVRVLQEVPNFIYTMSRNPESYSTWTNRESALRASAVERSASR